MYVKRTISGFVRHQQIEKISHGWLHRNDFIDRSEIFSVQSILALCQWMGSHHEIDLVIWCFWARQAYQTLMDFGQRKVHDHATSSVYTTAKGFPCNWVRPCEQRYWTSSTFSTPVSEHSMPCSSHCVQKSREVQKSGNKPESQQGTFWTSKKLAGHDITLKLFSTDLMRCVRMEKESAQGGMVLAGRMQHLTA